MRVNRARRDIGLALICLATLLSLMAEPAWAVRTAGSIAHSADIASAPTDSADKPSPEPSPEPSPTPDPSPSPSPEPSPEPSPSPTTEPSPAPSPTTSPPPKGDPPPPPTGGGSTSGSGTTSSSGTTTGGVVAGTTSTALLPKLQDRATPAAEPVGKKKPKTTAIEAVDASSLGADDPWIDSVSSIIAELASVGTTTGSAACAVDGCSPLANGADPLTVILLGGFVTGALAIAIHFARRRLHRLPSR